MYASREHFQFSKKNAKRVDTDKTSWDKCAEEMDLTTSKGFHQQYVLHFTDGSGWKIEKVKVEGSISG